MANVSFIRKELSKLLPAYRLIRDCLSGQDRIKEAGTKYLPMPNASDTSDQNVSRYKGYKGRAVFYNVTRRTLYGLIGQVFAREPVVELPASLKVVEEDATGTGVSASQQAKRILNYALGYGRCGILVDYPDTEGSTTKAELESGNIRPTITVFDPSVIINWRTVTIGAKKLLSLVVIAEPWAFLDDGFEIKHGCQFRVLSLEGDKDENDNVVGSLRYKVELYRESQPTVWTGEKIPVNKNFTHVVGPFYPTDSQGNHLSEIPFLFVGSEDNDINVDNPPIYDLATLNVAHYRNSADYEEASYVMGQPTYWFSGLTEDWMKNVLDGEIRLGSWGGVPLPAGANAGLIQMNPNTMPFEAMAHKERQMVALGAKLVEQKTVQRTATEAEQDEVAESSFLATAAKNVTAAMEWAFKWCTVFTGDDAGTIEYKLNTEFDIATITPEQRAETIKEWQGGALTFDEMRAVLRKSGVATLDDDEAREKIDTERADEIARVAAVMDDVGNNGVGDA